MGPNVVINSNLNLIVLVLAYMCSGKESMLNDGVIGLRSGRLLCEDVNQGVFVRMRHNILDWHCNQRHDQFSIYDRLVWIIRRGAAVNIIQYKLV